MRGTLTLAAAALLVACSGTPSSSSADVGAAGDSGDLGRADAAELSDASAPGLDAAEAIPDAGAATDAAESVADAAAPESGADAAAADASPAGADSGTRANGTVGAWTALPTMPVARANHCMTTANGYLVVIGGNYKNTSGNFQSLDSVHVAKLHGDGTVDPWILAGTTPSPVTQCNATSSGSTVYLAAGLFTDNTLDSNVYAATLSDAGALSSFSLIGTLPDGDLPISSKAFVIGGALYVAYSTADTAEQTLMLHAPLAPALGTWSSDVVVNQFRGQAQYTFEGSFFQVLGGYLGPSQNNDSVADVSSFALNADGSVGAATATTPLPNPVVAAQAVAVDGYLFQVGGKAAMLGANGVADVWSAKVDASGAVGTWSAQPALPQPRTNHAMVSAGDFLYQTGGGSTGPGLNTGWSARVRW